MSSCSSLFSLLFNKSDPTFTFYNEVIKSIIENPEQISALLNDDIKNISLVHITTHIDRLIQLFYLFHSQYVASGKTAAQIVRLLIQLIPLIYELVEEAALLKLLIYALHIVLPFSPLTLGRLATVLVDCGNLLEQLTSNPSSSELVRDWICSSKSAVRDAATLETWTRRIIEMSDSCTSDHGIAKETRQWGALIVLKKSLLELVHMLAQQTEESQHQSPNSHLPPFARMKQLTEDDKKAYRTWRQKPTDQLPDLTDDMVDLLSAFNLPAPDSGRMLRCTIERLEHEKTIAILGVVMGTFPCKFCNEMARHMIRPTRNIDSTTGIISAETTRKLGLDVLGKRMGDWSVLLSTQALKSMQDLSRSGAFGSVHRKLVDLASGCWTWDLVGSEAQRKSIRVPLARTRCGKKLWILWQVDVGFDGDVGIEKQVVKVWDIGIFSEISQAIDRVAIIQKNYSAGLIRQCRQRPLTIAEKFVPTRFPSSPDSVVKVLRTPELDIRAVDKDTIEMSNKFYALTEPVIRSVLANNVTAEFPFDLSEDEARVIQHFETASLILGRSGTGKTTCLIFKLVGKYAARKAVVGERTVRQLQADDDPFLSIGEDHLSEDTVLTLNDECFPLVCTFDQFLKILENTVRVMNRKDFSSPTEKTETITEHLPPCAESILKKSQAKHSRKPQLVDYYAFKLDYWPRLPSRLTKDLPIELVFAEIIGMIKGSASSRASLIPLCREEYFERSCRLAPAFTLASDRERVYEIFEKYEALKAKWGDVDFVDRVVRVLRAMREDHVLRQHLRSTFDEVYIDEVQDQRCLDIEMLLSIIKDPRGFHLAGDTAQTISQDSTFRFPDIKALFYEHFAASSASANQVQIARPMLFTLSKNYRSHQGILALASLVMDMLWNGNSPSHSVLHRDPRILTTKAKGFPETVDKLQPEIGQLCGPKPVLFVGCDSQILTAKHVGLVKLSERIADFGAEQVILVRDDDAKAKLQTEIGDAALVLTILQSKGMEFDDVILWDFFTGCPSPAGVRSLGALADGRSEGFNAKKHAVMCSNLKHLYVAITRARIKFSMIESSERAVAPVIKLFTRNPLKPLVEVARPHDSHFTDKLMELRPGTSVDPRRWSLRGEQLMQQRNFNDALMCFRKAKDHRGEKIAHAHVLEEEGRRCSAVDDVVGFTQNLQAAVKMFLEEKLVGDAVRNLVRMGKFESAAGLWFQDQKYGKAAPLFAEAGLFDKAANCYHLTERYDEAASAFRQGKHFDELVSYLSENHHLIGSRCYRSHSRLCNLMIKQGRISPAYRELAIKMLQSHAEQEKFFIEYEMHEQLTDFYADHGRYKNLFFLLIKMGEMERALNIVAANNSLLSVYDVPEDFILKVLDYVLAGRLICLPEEGSDAIPKLTHQEDYFPTPKQLKRSGVWDSGYQFIRHWQDAESYKQLLEMEITLIKKLLCLYITLNPARMVQASSLAELPFEIVEEAISTVKGLFSGPKNDAWSVALLFTGVFDMDAASETYILLPWSPLRQTSTDTDTRNYPQLAKEWLLDEMASAILILDEKAKKLYSMEWPVRCVWFMTKGYCQTAQRGECTWSHEVLYPSNCSRMIENLLRVNLIFCNLTFLYYHRIMAEHFQEKFLGIRRSWLERLLREMTYISSFEQDTSALMKTHTKLFRRDRFAAIASCLEELLFHRLGREWDRRSDLSSLLEQIQLSQSLGPSVEMRFSRALSYKIYKLTDGRSIERQLQTLQILRSLEGDINNHHAQTFPSALPELDREIYKQCLVQLVIGFSRILSRLNEVFSKDPKFKFSFGRRGYPQWILQRRNAELLATAIIYLGSTSTPPRGFMEAWTKAKETFEYRYIRADYLRHKTVEELCEKLARSFVAYNSKNALVLVARDTEKPNTFSNLLKKFRVKTVAMNLLCGMRPTEPHTGFHSSISTEPTEQYLKSEIEAVTKIQQFWRSRFSKLKAFRIFKQKPEAKAVAFFIALGAYKSTTLPIRVILVSQGVDLHLQLANAQKTLYELRKRIIAHTNDARLSIDRFDSLDEVLQRLPNIDDKLESAAEKMSRDHLTKQIERGNLAELQETLRDVEDIVNNVEDDMREENEVVNKISKGLSQDR
ncbi:MAG: hypothetical protein M1834_004702 [Cirrosporium novae-zelandiae]|nr:MAG: hypothetical protein M1834_004702 [Cirrosporium novae-zelandiae]